jgi:hypothetical protein
VTPTASGECDPADVPSPLACATFTSTSGTQGGVSVPWLATDPVRIQLVSVGDTPALVVDTPCNTLDVPVALAGRALVPDTDRIAVTAMGCLGDGGDREAWATKVVSRPMTYRLDGSRLTLTSGDVRLVLERTA